jgi:DNA-binding response OmpR family regulator
MNEPVCNVLVIDDNPTLRSIITQRLSDEGYRVQAAEGVRASLRVSTEFLPQLILVDVPLNTVEYCCRIHRASAGAVN